MHPAIEQTHLHHQTCEQERGYTLVGGFGKAQPHVNRSALLRRDGWTVEPIR